MSLARRTEAIEPFLAVEVAERAQQMEQQGVDVVHLGYGEPDFAPPAVVQQALDRALADGRMRYTHSLGIPPLREAIVDHYRATYGVKISADQVLVTPGTSPAMMLLFGALLDPGDEVVLSDPYYACYPNFVRYADGVPVYVDTTEEDGFQYRPTRLAPCCRPSAWPPSRPWPARTGPGSSPTRSITDSRTVDGTDPSWSSPIGRSC
jgi:aspartate/methionine/tyrosine aminotransferase